VKLGDGAVATRDSTRELVARLILERGPQSAAALAVELELSAAAIRRHLDALVADGLLIESRPRTAMTTSPPRPCDTCATPAANTRWWPSPSTAPTRWRPR
jgi:predicted ArsR family transcriptional regulator